MNIKAVIGAGYGDEGKGLMTDYFCRNAHDNKVLNIKVNGGAQAGHTVCALDSGEYKHWVFRQYGSGTFAGADTYLLNTFMVNINELLKEREALKEIYNIQTKLYIDRRCRVTLPIDILLNRFIEDSRTHKHGSCGLGIYETFHRNNDFRTITLNDIISTFCNKSIREFENILNELSCDYIKFRCNELINDNISFTDDDINTILKQAFQWNKELIDNLADIAKIYDIIFINSLSELLGYKSYNTVVFECSQGLELDQYEERNWPHLTPSNTGLINIVNEIDSNKYLKDIDTEICFVSRAYKTKHGAGLFIEKDDNIQNIYGLYDRTNHPNQYQGSLRYGLLNLGRIKKLILKQLELCNNIANINSSISITHLDQTNAALLTNKGRIDIKDIDKNSFGVNNTIYKSYGEKASDIIY